MTNGQLYGAVQWAQYIGVLIVSLTLLFGGGVFAGWAGWRKKEVATLSGLCVAVLGLIILFRWMP